MSRNLGTLLLLVACAAPSVAAAEDGPRLTVDSKEVDFGVIMHGAKAEMKLAISNTGTEELVIQRVKPSCGCTVARYPKTLAPGASGELALTFDSSDRPAGYQSFRVAIYSNDPTQRDRGAYCTMIAMRGEVKTLYRVAPHGAYFGEVIRGTEGSEKTVIVTGRGEAASGFTATLETEVPDYMQVELEPLPRSDRRNGVKVKIRLLPHAPYGQLDDRLVFKTSFAMQPLFRLPVTALVNRRIMGPPAVHFGPVPRAKGAERMIVVERRDTKDGIEVAAVRYDRERLEVSYEAVNKRRVEAQVRVRPGAPPGAYAGEIEFFLDDPDQSLVTVPVYLRVEPEVRVEPASILMPQGTKPGARFARFTVRVPEGRVVKEATVAGGLRAEVAESGGVFEVSLYAPKSGTLPTTPTVVTLVTDVPGEEATRVELIPR